MYLTAFWGLSLYVSPLGKEVRMSRLETKKMVRVMKLTALILLSACMVASAKGHTQSINLSVKSASLEKVFAEIKKQSGYSIFYNYRLLEDTKPVTIDIKNASVADAMKLCLEGQPLDFEIAGKSIAITARDVKNKSSDLPLPPSIDIRGRLINEKGEGVEGVTVTVKGTNTATATDANGAFFLKDINENATLVLTGVNVETQEVQVRGRTDLASISLKTKVASAKEVIVTVNTGYQTISKERATGSFSVIDPARLESKLKPGLLSALEGQAAGLVVTKEGKIEIRGRSTFIAAADPLIVVDGYPISGGLETINVDNIENITVLKDAVAASIYGARASNGVIVITTTQGKRGGLQVSYKAIAGITLKPDLTKLNRASTPDYIDAETEVFNTSTFPALYYDMNIGVSQVTYLLRQKQLGLITQAQLDAQIAQLKTIDNLSQVQNYLFRNQFTQQHNISLSGGTEKSLLNASVRYTNSQNNTIHNGDNRLIFDIKNEWKPKNNVSIRVFSNVNYATSAAPVRSWQEFTAYQLGSFMQPYTQLVNPVSGEPQDIFANRKPVLQNQYNNVKGLKPMNYNPLADLELETATTRNLQARLGANMNWMLFSGLSAEIGGSWNIESGASRQLYDANAYRVRSWFNAATSVSSPATKHYVPDGAVLDESRYMNQSYTVRGQLTFNRVVAGKHRISAIAGNEISKYLTDINTYPTRYGYNPQAGTFATFNYADFNAGVYNADMQYSSDRPTASIGSMVLQDNRFVSWYSNASYEYDNRFLLSGSVRLDQTNFFGTDPKYRYRPNWSAGGTYKLSNEKFFDVSWINKLHIRGSYGINGNVNLNSGPFLIIAPSSYSTSTGDISYRIVSPPNNTLRWERTNIMNLGSDLSFLNKRLNVSVDYYQKLSKDLFGPDYIDPTYGFTSVTRNLGEVRNTGFEVTAEYDVVKKKEFNWNVFFNGSYNTSKVTKFNYNYTFTSYLMVPSTIFVDVTAPRTGYALREGYPMDAVFSYPFAGLDNTGSALFYTSDKQKVAGNQLKVKDVNYSGTIRPKYVLNLTNTVSYKHFDLSFMVVAKLGHVMRTSSFFGSNYQNKYVADRWRQPGDESKTIYPKLGWQPSYASYFPYADVFIQSANYLKLRDVSLGYTIENKFLKRVGFTNARIQLQGRNLLYVAANKDGIDPEIAELNQAGSSSRFIEQGFTSLQLRPEFYLGISLKF